MAYSHHSGITGMLGVEEKPMFTKYKVNFNPNSTVTHLAAANDSLVIAMSSGVMLRINLKNAQNHQEIELNRIIPGASITGIFLDPNGDHLLISYPTELLYHNKKLSKPKPINKLKSQEVTAVGWYPFEKDTRVDTTTKPILVGTIRGMLYEMEISGDESKFPLGSMEIYCKQVFDISQNVPPAITGLQFHQTGERDEYFVIVTTINRLYQFIGKNNGSDDRPFLQPLFNKYLNTPETCQVMHSSLKYSCLQLHSAKPFSMPDHLSWLTETGILHGKVDPSNKNSLVTKQKMYHFLSDPPLSFVATKFHFFLLYPDNVTIVSVLNHEVVFIDVFNEAHGKLVNISKDPMTGTIWLFNERAVYRYAIHKEDRHVWQIYLDEGNYAQAKLYCGDDQPMNLEQVLLKEAEDLFSKEKYEQSAVVYAETKSSFEGIALKFLNANQSKALKIFLTKKVEDAIKKDRQAHVTMLVLWILEIQLSQLGALRVQGKENTSDYAALTSEMISFLKRDLILKCCRRNKNVIYNLMSKHGDSNLSLFAELNNDFEKIIYNRIYREDYHAALADLKRQNNLELWYHFAATLIQAIPRETISAIISLEKPLNPSRLLPALVSARSYQSSELIRYLEYCTSNLNCQEQAVHNFLLSLYAQHRPERLIKYIEMQGEEASMVNYDIGYALRVCQQYKRSKACVHLSSLLGLWENAVEQALEISVDVAKEVASQAKDKRLWLKIAEHIVKNKNDIAQAMSFIQHCESVKIEDILPFFPDFVTIDHFKDAICSSLQEYNQHIQDLHEDMEDASKSAEAIRTEIQSFRNKCTIIEEHAVCCICGEALLRGRQMRQFYAFPCSHTFHTECLIDETEPLLSEEETQHLAELLKTLPSSDRIRAYTPFISSQCLYCGDRMIQFIKKPFILDEEYDRIQEEWK